MYKVDTIFIIVSKIYIVCIIYWIHEYEWRNRLIWFSRNKYIFSIGYWEKTHTNRLILLTMNPILSLMQGIHKKWWNILTEKIISQCRTIYKRIFSPTIYQCTVFIRIQFHTYFSNYRISKICCSMYIKYSFLHEILQRSCSEHLCKVLIIFSYVRQSTLVLAVFTRIVSILISNNRYSL